MSKSESIKKSDEKALKPGLSPVDTYFSKLIIKTLPKWHKIKATPNVLTTIGLIFTILAIYFIYKRSVYLAIICVILRAYFDYADGLLARKYDQTSLFGDYYDHVVDSIFFALPLLLLFFFSNLRILLIPLVITYIITILYNVGIEKAYNKKTGKGGTVLLGSFLTPPKFLNKYYADVYTYSIFIVLIIILCVKDPRRT